MATYSWRAMSANSRTRSGSFSAARPNGSGQVDKAPAANAAPEFSVNECRGSELTVTGIECGVVAASCCSAFDHRADSRADGSACTLTWLISSSTTSRRVEDRATAPSPSIRLPCGPTSMMSWKKRPTFSASESRVRRSSARAAGSRRGSSNGAIC